MTGFIPFLIALAIATVLFFLAYNFLSTSFQLRRRNIAKEHQELVAQVNRLESERRELANELRELEKNYTLLKHDIKPTANLASKVKLPDTEDDSIDERMGNFMLSNSMITIEQHEKAVRAMEHLQMDMAGVCHSLGFISVEQANAIRKQIKS